jgi:hypothetical protein
MYESSVPNKLNKLPGSLSYSIAEPELKSGFSDCQYNVLSFFPHVNVFGSVNVDGT